MVPRKNSRAKAVQASPKKSPSTKKRPTATNVDSRPSKRQNAGLTVKEVLDSDLTKVAREYWARTSTSDLKGVFKEAIVEEIYSERGLNPKNGSHSQVVEILEYNSYLEEYLWPNFTATSSFTHAMSIAVILNQKFSSSLPAWETLRKSGPEKFKIYLITFLQSYSEQVSLSTPEKTSFVLFLINIFKSLEEPMVRDPCLRLVSLSLWKSLSVGRLKQEITQFPQLRRHWKRLLKAKGESEFGPLEAQFLPRLLDSFLTCVEEATDPLLPVVRYCERVLELLIDLLSQLPTRRFLRSVLQDMHLCARCRLSPLGRRREGEPAAEGLCVTADAPGGRGGQGEEVGPTAHHTRHTSVSVQAAAAVA
jgi:intron-binding protein aquarius